MGAVFLFVLLFGGLAAFVGWKWHQRRRIADAWQSVASEHGLDFSSDWLLQEFTLTGGYRDVFIQVESEVRNRGTDRPTRKFTRWSATLPDNFPTNLVISSSGEAPLTDAMLAAPENVPTGIAEIDDQYLVRSDRPDDVREFFETSGVDEAFRIPEETDKRLEIGGGEIVLQAPRLVRYPLELEETLDTLAEFAGELRDLDADPSSSAAADTGGAADTGTADGEADPEDYAKTWD